MGGDLEPTAPARVLALALELMPRASGLVADHEAHDRFPRADSPMQVNPRLRELHRVLVCALFGQERDARLGRDRVVRLHAAVREADPGRRDPPPSAPAIGRRFNEGAAVGDRVRQPRP